MSNVQNSATLVGRILLAVMFFTAGLSKFAGLEGTAGYIASAGLPMPQVLALGTAVLEVVGGLMLIVGWQARWAALALAVFTLLAALLFHNYWAKPEAQQMMQQLLFNKNLAIVGGLLMVFAFGAGGFSLDARRRAGNGGLLRA
jgi:putative oxidoreductase